LKHRRRTNSLFPSQREHFHRRSRNYFAPFARSRRCLEMPWLRSSSRHEELAEKAQHWSVGHSRFRPNSNAPLECWCDMLSRPRTVSIITLSSGFCNSDLTTAPGLQPYEAVPA